MLGKKWKQMHGKAVKTLEKSLKIKEKGGFSELALFNTFEDFKGLRLKINLTLEEASFLLGISETTLYKWEKGENKPSKKALQLLKKIVNDKAFTNESTNKFKYIDLFAGIGGFRKAFDSVGGKCVFTSEIDKFARHTYMANNTCDHLVVGDIKQITEQEIPSFDFLIAGFPCQPFSLAGVSKLNSLGNKHGFEDYTRGTLFFDIARIIKYHQPKGFLLENVKNLMSHDKGKTFKVIVHTLTQELGYNISYRVIDAKGMLPQHRERIFIVGLRDKTNFNINNLIFPEPSNGPSLKTILHPEDGSELEEYPYTYGSKALVNEKYTLTDKLWQYLQHYADKHRKKGNGFGFGLVSPTGVARTLSARYFKDGSEILVHQDYRNPRKLTPRECARLMGFDSTFESKFLIPVSDTQAYKQFGNSVAVPVVKKIAAEISKTIAKK